jgi:hypothetical protein
LDGGLGGVSDYRLRARFRRGAAGRPSLLRPCPGRRHPRAGSFIHTSEWSPSVSQAPPGGAPLPTLPRAWVPPSPPLPSLATSGPILLYWNAVGAVPWPPTVCGACHLQPLVDFGAIREPGVPGMVMDLARKAGISPPLPAGWDGCALLRQSPP